ncbi:unnamed protein product [Oreochromis niloticus]|nr:unnamed protein product [Mustela putorius furo]
MPLGRNALVGLAVGATAGLVAFVYRLWDSRRWSQSLVLETRPADGGALLGDTLDAQEMEAQQQAPAAVEAVDQGLSPEQQLDQVLCCIASLRSEVAELRGSLQAMAWQINQDVK